MILRQNSIGERERTGRGEGGGKRRSREGMVMVVRGVGLGTKDRHANPAGDSNSKLFDSKPTQNQQTMKI
jgi:hypothetical protein